MYIRGGRVVVAAGVSALALFAGPVAWAEGEPVPGADAGVVPAPGADAGAAADPVDVEARLYPDSEIIAPDRTLNVRAIAALQKGTVKKLGLTLALPAGVTYVKELDNASDLGVCKPAADGRSVTCVAVPDDKTLSVYLELKVGADVKPGTALEFTTTADIGDAVDSKPENNKASAKVAVRTAADLGIAWTTAPKGPVKVGETVPTEVTVTNHGPGPVPFSGVYLGFGFDYWPESGYDAACDPDPGELVCNVDKELASGETVKFAFTWKFPKEAAGTTYKVPTRIYTSSPLDGNRENDKTELVFEIEKSSSSPSPSATPSATPTPTAAPTATPTPTPTPTASPSPTGGGGALAETGAGFPVAGLSAGAGALVVVGGALVVRQRRRRS